MSKKLKGPKPTEEVLNKKIETVSATPNEPKELEGQPIGNAENTAPGNEGVASSVCGGDTCHEQFQPAPGDHPVRMRHNKPEGGSHTTSAPSDPLPHPHKTQDPHKVKMFTRCGEDRIKHPGTSTRDWNITGAPAPNKEEK